MQLVSQEPFTLVLPYKKRTLHQPPSYTPKKLFLLPSVEIQNKAAQNQLEKDKEGNQTGFLFQLCGAVCFFFKGEIKQNQKNVFSLWETSTSKVAQLSYLQQISSNRHQNTGRGSVLANLYPTWGQAGKGGEKEGKKEGGKERKGVKEGRRRGYVISNYYSLSTLPSALHMSTP